jgi:hypothetical protein
LSSREGFMNRPFLQIAVVLTCGLLFCSGMRAQENDPQGSSGAAPAATGLDTATQISENPPLSGLDEPSFEPGYGARSYLAPRVQVSGSVNANGLGTIGGPPSITETTRGLGSLTLQKLWKIHPLDVDYTGGVAYYNGTQGKTYQLHSMGATQRFLWRTGQFALRDFFSYFPEGAFGLNSYGGGAALGGGGGQGQGTGGLTGGGIGSGSGNGVFNNGQFGGTHSPRINNQSIVDISQYLSPRSSVVLGGGYGRTEFINNAQGYINSQQTTAQAGYNYQIRRHDQIALSYAFQEFHFPRSTSNPSGSFNVHLFHVMYGHRISGKLNFKIGGGPQWIHTHQFAPVSAIVNGNLILFFTPLNTTSLSGSGQATLTYQVSSHTGMILTYRRFMNPGSGFFAGANTDAVRYGVNHALTRRWNVLADVGYSHNSRLLSGKTQTANNATHYRDWYAGGAIRRQLGRQLGAFASYQYDTLGFGSGFCATSCSPGNRGYDRHVGLIGLDWTPRPIRLE